MKKCMLLSMIAVLCAAAGVQAAVIVWDDVMDLVDETDVVTDGALVEAINMCGSGITANPVVNGVPFVDTSDKLSKNTDLTTFCTSVSAPSSYDDLLSTLDFAATTASMTVGSGLLEVGKNYLIQIWYVDDRAAQDARTMQYSGTGDSSDLSGPVNDQYVIGTFTADSTSQQVWIVAGGGTDDAHANAYQIRHQLPKAHTPAPTGIAVNPMVLDPDNPGKISWQDPNTAAQGGDPNLVSVDSYDITYYIIDTDEVTTDDPNWDRAEGVTFDDDVHSPYTIPAPGIGWDQTMFWRVDTHVTWNSTEITENPVIGANWRFATRPEYIAPTITFGSVITAMDILPAALSAEVETDSISIANHPLNAPVFTVLTDDIEFPNGADAPLTDTTGDYANPTATLTTDMPGIYKVLLQVDDGITFLEAIAVVDVYADDCQAAKDAGNWVGANYFDRDGDCFVELEDYSEFAADWLNDRSMDVQAEDTTPGGSVPLDVYENDRIEAESYDLETTDPNSCSDFPITDETGIRFITIENVGPLDETITRTSHSGANNWIEYYEVPVPAPGTYDVYLRYAQRPAATQTLSFGTKDDPDLYGTTDPLGSTGEWDNYVDMKSGTVTFTTAGLHTVRVTWSGGVNLDWFAFDF